MSVGGGMWVRIDANAPLHPKLGDAGPEAAWWWVCGLAHCNRSTTDGIIRKRDLPLLYPAAAYSRARMEKLSAQLVKAGLWHDEGDSYRVHDYRVQQDAATREAVELRRAYEASRKAEQRAAVRAKLNASSPGHVPDIVPDDVPDMSHGTVPRTGAPALAHEPAPARVDAPPRAPSDRPTDRPTVLRDPHEGGSGSQVARPTALVSLVTAHKTATMGGVREVLESSYAAAYAQRWGSTWSYSEPTDGMHVHAVATWCMAQPQPEAAAREVIAGAYATPRLVTGRRAPWSWIAEKPDVYAATGRESLARSRIEPVMSPEAHAGLVAAVRATGSKGAQS